jgi:cell division protein FtsL
MTPLNIFFFIALFVFIILWVYELYETRKLRAAYKMAESAVEDFISAFTELKSVINTNADSQRALRAAVDRHEKSLAIMDALIEVHGQALKIAPNLKTMLESEVIEDFPIEGAEGDL